MIGIKQEFVQVNQYTRPGKKLNGVKGIVWHYTADPGASAQNIRDYFNGTCIREKRYASAHLVVDDKEVIQMIPFDEVAYHAHDKSLCFPDELKPNANLCTIGVEMCIDKNGNITEATFQNAVELGVQLCKMFNLDPFKNFYRHYDITHKNCPAPWVANPSEFERFKKLVKEKLSEGIPKEPAQKPQSAPKKYVLPTGILKQGMKGDAVKQLQIALNVLGFNCGTPDGIFGPKTLEALKAFQKSAGLTVDGIYGPKTREAMDRRLNG